MAIENKVTLNGQIKSLRKTIDENGNVLGVLVGLNVIRRPKKISGNKYSEIRSDTVIVRFRNKEMIDYLEAHDTVEGDFLEVVGTYCTIIGPTTYYCKYCGAENKYDGTSTFVHPLCVKHEDLKPKVKELVELSRSDVRGTKDEIQKIIESKKHASGEIVNIKEVKETETGGVVVEVTSRDVITEAEIRKYLQWVGEISNNVILIGNVCNDPVYTPVEKGGRACLYQIGINRKVFIKEDSPDIRSDFPYIKSLGDQADSDRDALVQGSLILVDGSIQARDGFYMKKHCAICGEENNVIGGAMEVVPYSVEYLRNCNSLSKEDDDDEWAGDFDLDEDDDDLDFLNDDDSDDDEL